MPVSNHPDRYYRSAGAVPFTGILLMLGAGTAAAVVCGALYAAAVWYIAYDVVPFICAPLAGAGIGLAVKAGAQAGRARHRGFLALVGLAMGALGCYFAWVFFIRIWDGAGFWLWDPQLLLMAINEISEIGVWDNQPTGVWLKVIYAIEALAIMIPAAIVAALETAPFCNGCNKWTRQIPQNAILKSSDQEALREQLEESRYEALDDLFDPSVNPADCFHAGVYVCPDCEESNYLTVSHVTITQKGGETQQSVNRFVNYLWVPSDVVDQIRRLAGGNQQADVNDATADIAKAFGGPDT